MLFSMKRILIPLISIIVFLVVLSLSESASVYNNEIHNNNVGVKRHYGRQSTVRDNNIRDNYIAGIEMMRFSQ